MPSHYESRFFNLLFLIFSLLLSSSISAQTLTSFRLSSEKVTINTPVTALVEFRESENNWCGFYIDWGDGKDPQSFRIGRKPDLTSPVSRQRTFEKAGAYTLRAYGAFVSRGLQSAEKCEGSLQPVTLIVYDPSQEKGDEREKIALIEEKKKLEDVRIELEEKVRQLEIDRLRMNADIKKEAGETRKITEEKNPVAKPPATLNVASFDCRKASTTVEKLICESPSLSKLDVDLNRKYKEALTLDPGIKQSQIEWIKNRNKCSSKACIEAAYVNRLESLSLRVSEGDKISSASQSNSLTSSESKGRTESHSLSNREKLVLERMHIAAMCAGFYSKYLSGASRASCQANDTLKCNAWFTRERYRELHDYDNLEARGFPQGFANYVRSVRKDFDQSYMSGVNGQTDNGKARACVKYLDSFIN